MLRQCLTFNLPFSTPSGGPDAAALPWRPLHEGRDMAGSGRRSEQGEGCSSCTSSKLLCKCKWLMTEAYVIGLPSRNSAEKFWGSLLCSICEMSQMQASACACVRSPCACAVLFGNSVYTLEASGVGLTPFAQFIVCLSAFRVPSRASESGEQTAGSALPRQPLQAHRIAKCRGCTCFRGSHRMLTKPGVHACRASMLTCPASFTCPFAATLASLTWRSCSALAPSDQQ